MTLATYTGVNIAHIHMDESVLTYLSKACKTAAALDYAQYFTTKMQVQFTLSFFLLFFHCLLHTFRRQRHDVTQECPRAIASSEVGTN